ncbi:MAG TPA: putative sugar nucleotidyl transferase [Candidatus Omnitrophota bacterium]|nr:putative sugar nucleotidyl transferase [Candidatus Omnitrophota bacterium]
MKIILFEDEGYKKLLPLVLMRPVWGLVCGASTILERIEREYPKAEIALEARGGKPSAEKAKRINGRMAAPSMREIVHPWDLITNLKEFLEDDLKHLGTGIKGKTHSSVVFYNKKNILVEKGAEIDAHCVLDARNGPIYIGAGTIVHPGTLLRGPLSIGRHCRIAGEITSSVIMSYVNKAHYGFIGHSYICSWVNLGAGTTNSNLKNNYGPVSVMVDGKRVNSGETFVGCFIGDHAKTAIGSMIYTGCVIGAGANLFGQPYYKKFVPSFSWGVTEEARLEDVIAIARAAMKRRGIELSPADIALFKKAFEQTKSERS